jgi:tetratricopeptide (TPR) repeat protein
MLLLAAWACAGLGATAGAQPGLAVGDPPLPAAAAAPWTDAVAALEAAAISPRPWSPDARAWRSALAALATAAEAALAHPAPLRASLRAHVAVGWWVRAAAAADALAARAVADPWADPDEPVPDLAPARLRDVAAEAWRELGFARYQAGDLEGAQGVFARWVEALPDDPEALRWIGRVLLERAEPDAALPYLERWVALRPDDAEAAYFVDQARLAIRVGSVASAGFQDGLAAHAAGDLAAAAEAFDAARAAAPAFADAHAWAGRVALERGAPAAAVAAFESAAALRPEDPAVAYFLGVARTQEAFGVAAGSAFYAGIEAYEAGDVPAAAERFGEAVAANDRFVEAWVWRARTLQETGRLAAAEAAWSSVVELDPDDARALFFRERLRQQLAYGVDADPEVAAAFAAGVAAFEAADLATARARFESVVAADPGSALGWSWLGRVAYTVRDFAAAAEAYGRAAELLPDDPDVAWFAEDAARRAAPDEPPEDVTPDDAPDAAPAAAEPPAEPPEPEAP